MHAKAPLHKAFCRQLIHMASVLGMNSCVHSVILPGWIWCHLQSAHEVKDDLIIWQTENGRELSTMTPQNSERSGRQTNTRRWRTKSTVPCRMSCVWKMTAGQNTGEDDSYPNRCPFNDSVQPFWSTLTGDAGLIPPKQPYVCHSILGQWHLQSGLTDIWRQTAEAVPSLYVVTQSR